MQNSLSSIIGFSTQETFSRFIMYVGNWSSIAQCGWGASGHNNHIYKFFRVVKNRDLYKCWYFDDRVTWRLKKWLSKSEIRSCPMYLSFFYCISSSFIVIFPRPCSTISSNSQLKTKSGKFDIFLTFAVDSEFATNY